MKRYLGYLAGAVVALSAAATLALPVVIIWALWCIVTEVCQWRGVP